MRSKVVVILAGLCVFISACATNKTIPVASTIERMGVVYLIRSDKPFTGVVITKYISGRPKTSIEYAEGIKHGRQIEWLENGRKSEVITWHNGLRDGEQVEWYENQQKAFQGRMQQGKWVGECLGWYPDGRPAFQICFQDGQGKGNTIEITWNNNNLVHNFPDVKIDGAWIEWHASGKLVRWERYDSGKLVEKRK